MTNHYRINERKLNNILSALQDICIRNPNYTTLPPQEQWPKTREVAEYCGTTIYLARYYLMKLVDSNKAYVSPKSVNKSLRWFIADQAILHYTQKDK